MKNSLYSGKGAAAIAAAAVLVAGLAAAVPAFAQTSTGEGGEGWAIGAHSAIAVSGTAGEGNDMRIMEIPGIVGTVASVSGTTLTVTGYSPLKEPIRPMPMGIPMHVVTGTFTGAATTTYTVDASNAKIYKTGATSTVSLSAIAVGDHILVQGAVSGTNVTATVIRDGFAVPGPMPGPRRFPPVHPSSTFGSSTYQFPIQGNGEPVIGGSVTAISGTTLTLANEGSASYTINASGATVVRNGTTTALANVAVGDHILVQGAVSGTSITASSILDQGMPKATSTNASSTHPEGHGFGLGGGVGFKVGGFFGAIGGFFQHLFGF